LEGFEKWEETATSSAVKEKASGKMAQIALIYPYVYEQAANAMLFHPLGIAQLRAILQRDGLSVDILDHTFRRREDILSELSETRPRIVGIYVMMTMTRSAIDLAKRIKALLPKAVLVCGGPMPTLKPEQFSADFDAVFLGEAVDSFPRFCRDYLASSDIADVFANHADYPGLYATDAYGSITAQTPVRSTDEQSLNAFPIPDRRGFDHARYQEFWQKKTGFSLAGIMTTYGCPHRCDFCSKPVYGTNFRRRSLHCIMEEVRDIRSYGYEGLWVADDCFTQDLGHVRAFCTSMIDEGMDMKWMCLSRTENMMSDDIALMKEAGCTKVFFGLESGSNEVLRLMNKHTTVEAAETIVSLFSACGIKTAGFFMVGYPGESYDTIETTFSWALKLPLDEVSFTTPFPLPGTRLYEKVTGLKRDDDWNYENENRMVFKSEFDEVYLRKRIEETCDRFNRHRAQGGKGR
jgi:anaerobic magnesium-protoporphyrin IX monomethyl ester cyclase